MTWRIAVWAALVVPAAWACNSTVTVLGGGAGGAGSSGHTSASSLFSSATTANGTTSNGTTSGPTTVSATTDASNVSATADAATSTASASSGGGTTGVAYLEALDYGAQGKYSFLDFTAQAGSDCKTILSDGSCTAYACPPNSPQGSLDAGDVTISGMGGSTVAKYNKPKGNYPQQPLPFLKVPDTVTFSIKGSAQVPAFEASIVLPESTKLVVPVDAQTVDSSQPLTVSWTGSEGQQLFQLYHQQSGIGVSCFWPASLQKTTISSTMLKQLPGGSTAFDAYSGNYKNVMANNGWDYQMYALGGFVSGYVNVK